MPKQRTIIMTGYSRVSTKAESQRTSFEAQPAIFKTLLSLPEYSHYKPAKEFYCDFGVSGTKLNRPGFKKMLEDAGLDVEIIDKKKIPHPSFPDKLMNQRVYQVSVNPYKKPLFEEIWIKNTSRFARNINGYQIIQTLRLAGVYVYFIDLDLSSRNESDLPAIRKRLDEDMAYSEQNSRNRKIVQIQYERENRLSGCPYGYIRHNKTKTTDPYYELHPKESLVVKKIFQYCIDGLGAVAIGKKLAEEGHFTRQGKPFAESSIKKILDNEKYIGLNTTGKYTTGPLFEKLGSAKIRDDYQDRLKPSDGLPAIITPEIWDAAHKALASRNTNPDALKKRQVVPKHPCKELLVCHYCGSHFVYDNNGGRGFFKCATKASKGVSACNCNNVFTYQLDKHIESLQKGELKFIIESDFQNTTISLITLVEAYLEKFKNPMSVPQLQEELSMLHTELEKKQQALGLLTECITDLDLGSDSLTTFKEKVSTVNAEITEIQAKIKTLKEPPLEIIGRIHTIFDTIYESFNQLKTIKTKYTKEEVYELLETFYIAGKTKNNTGGLPPEPIIMPVLKTGSFAFKLCKLGIQDFNYKFRNGLPRYESPDHFIQTKRNTIPLPEINPVDDETLTLEEKAQHYSKDTKSKWPVGTSPYNMVNAAYVAPDGGLGYIPNLGIENLPVTDQIKDYVDFLYQEFISIETQFNQRKGA